MRFVFLSARQQNYTQCVTTTLKIQATTDVSDGKDRPFISKGRLDRKKERERG